MIDIFSIQQGDIVEYGPYLCSESLKGNRYTGTYQDFMFWSPDERPIEMWVNLLNQKGLKIIVRASQVTNVFSQQGSSQ